MKICVYGAGAVGGLIAARLARSGNDVSVVARGAHLEAIRRHGLRIRDRAAGSEEAMAVKADERPSQLGTQDYVIVAVKAQSLTEVSQDIDSLCKAETSVVTAMNGVPWWFFDRLPFAHRLGAAGGTSVGTTGNGKPLLESLDPGGRLMRAIPTERIVGCVVHLAASTPEPGVISHNMGRKLILGEPGGKNSVRTGRIVAALNAAGFEALASGFIEKDFWVKLLGNVSFNPVSALTGSTADRLIEDREVKAYMVEIMREVLAIGRAVGVDAEIDPEARIDMARSLGQFKTSMLQDMEAGKPLEIDGLLAGTLEIARKAGVKAPHTEGLFGLIRARAVTTAQYRRAT